MFEMMFKLCIMFLTKTKTIMSLNCSQLPARVLKKVKLKVLANMD